MAKKKVIFAEPDNDFVDTLFSFLTLPLGTIVRLLRDEKLDSPAVSVGSLTTLYESLEKLDPKHFWTEEYCKSMLLKPINSSQWECQKLKVNLDATESSKYFICQNWDCSRGESCFYTNYNSAVCKCGKPMNREISFDKGTVVQDNSGVFVCKALGYVISDDLHVMPNSLTSVLGLIKGAGVDDAKLLEEITFSFGFAEFQYLLKCIISSKTPLTDFVFRENVLNTECEGLTAVVNAEVQTSSKKMTPKLIVAKSINKVLFGQAEGDFVDFIFGFLTMPLGSVASLLGGNTCLGCVDNLYNSVCLNCGNAY